MLLTELMEIESNREISPVRQHMTVGGETESYNSHVLSSFGFSNGAEEKLLGSIAMWWCNKRAGTFRILNVYCIFRITHYYW
jgi:hypothetical protein